MNIYKHEFKMHLKSVVIWSVALVLIVFVYLSAFTAISAETEVMNEMLANFPKELLVAFGMDNLDFTTVLGFYGVVFLFCQICLAIQASNYGFSLVSIEERELTADFLLAKPVKRSQILTNKLLAALTSLTISNVMVWISSFVVVEMVREGRDYDKTALVMVLLTIMVFQLFFLSVGMVISLLVKRVRTVTPFSMALAFGMYVLNGFGGMLGDVSLEVVSPFKHFDPNYIIENAKYDMLSLISVAVILISVIGSYMLYSRRNIPSAV